MRLGDVFDPRANILTQVRLVLAVGVIAWHAVLVSRIAPPPFNTQIIQDGCVDGFFAISGFLIVASWMHRPSVLPFLSARALRIFPGFWVALAVTAFLIAPATLMASTKGLPIGYWDSAAAYFFGGLDLTITQHRIAGTPSGLPIEAWNGSLWTLAWEFSCYILVAALGAFNLLRRHTMGILFATALALESTILLGLLPGDAMTISRFLLMFSAGGALFLYRDRIAANWWWVMAAIALVAVSVLLPDYRILGGLPLAYALIVGASLVRRPVLRTDLSYGVYVYAAPIQVGLALLGVTAPLPNAAFALLLTLPLAAASWFAIERPALRLKSSVGDALERWARGRPPTARRDEASSLTT